MLTSLLFREARTIEPRLTLHRDERLRELTFGLTRKDDEVAMRKRTRPRETAEVTFEHSVVRHGDVRARELEFTQTHAAREHNLVHEASKKKASNWPTDTGRDAWSRPLANYSLVAAQVDHRGTRTATNEQDAY